MNPIEINEKALEFLSRREFAEAQTLFYENAKTSPSHETYNNLGFFLLSEGLECKNGKVRNAEKLGLHYLLKAEKFKVTSINQANIATALENQYDFVNRQADADCSEALQEACKHMELAVRLRYSDELEFDRLRFLYLKNPSDAAVLGGVKALVGRFRTEECVEFYLNLLCIHAELKQCRQLLSTFHDRLNEMALLQLYCKCGMYEAGASLCDAVYRKFSLEAQDIAMLANCLFNAGKTEEALLLKRKIKEDELEYGGEKEFLADVNRIFEEASFRKELIQHSQFIPPYRMPCGFFGCKMHGVPFYEAP